MNILKSNSKFLIIMLSLVFILCVVIATLYYRESYYGKLTANDLLLQTNNIRGNNYIISFQYPQDWIVVKNDPLFMTKNDIIHFETGDETMKIILTSATPLASNNCEYFLKNYDQVDCQSKKQDGYTTIKVQYYNEAAAKYYFDYSLHFTDQSFILSAISTEKNEVSVAKKLSRFLSVSKVE